MLSVAVVDDEQAFSDALCRMCLCNDLTKLHEMSFRGSPSEVKDKLLAKGNYDKGEYADLNAGAGSNSWIGSKGDKVVSKKTVLAYY